MAEQLTPEEMDLAAQCASDILTEMWEHANEQEQLALISLARWWKEWYLKAGHKRLGRILLKYASGKD